MKAAIDLLMMAIGRKVAILGDMGELGKDEAALHAEVGTAAGQSGIDVLICVGPLCEHMAAAAKESAETCGQELSVIHMETVDELIEELPGLLKQGDTILVKASHFMHFETIVSHLQS